MVKRVVKLACSLAAATMIAGTGSSSAQTKLLRFPDIHADRIIFCYGGDLWQVSTKGGMAVRLTAHLGQELFPKFSPDGESIAFTGQYDGDEQVCVMPARGGVPKQLTYYPAHGPLPPRWGYDNQVYGWTPNGKSVLFRSLRDAYGGRVKSALYRVSRRGGLPQKLAMPTAGAGDFSPNGSKIVYSPLFRDFRTWKRYEGGWAQDLYVFDLKRHDARRIAASKRTERDPMWIGNTIYFVSDRDGTLNLYAYDIAIDRVRQLTRYTTWDVRWASSDNRSRIVYELNGELRVFDVKSAEDKRVSITVPHDGLAMRPSRCSAEKNVEGFRLSPKGERALFVARGDVFTVPIEKGPTRNLTASSNAHDKRARWSPDGAHLAFSLKDANEFRSIYIWSVAGGKLRRITGEYADEFGPAWDPDGDYLFYLSRREYAPQVSTVEWNYAGNRQVGIFALALRKDVKNPFAPESDEVTTGKEEEKDEKEKSKSGKMQPVKIDFNGLAERVIRVPVESDNIGNLSATRDYLLYIVSGAAFYGRGSYAKPALNIFDLEKREASVLAEDVAAYALSADGSKILIHQADAYHLCDVKPKLEDKDKKTVSLKGLMVDRVPEQEWAQIFDEVWRRYRDFFYVKNMHGYDWRAIGDRYRALVPHVAHRSDLNYLLGEMIAELNVGHAYVGGGQYEIPERPKVALPGARFQLDAKAGRYRIATIFRGENEEEGYRSPLSEVGVNVTAGDYVLAVDGEELRGSDNPYRLLQHKTDPVTLTVNAKPTFRGARRITYNPIASEARLLYLKWVKGNLARVTEATGGRVGYLHIPDMGGHGICQFIKWFYPQIRREGLVIDVRGNGGGNVSQWIIERLDTKLLGTHFGSYREDAETYPQTVFHGHMVCLLNETSASDGDIFPYRFREAGLGPLIGKRSWGGVVGISGHGPLIDGGNVNVPLVGTNSATGQWVIEGRGVEPDIEVENDPKAVIRGRDPQLERAIVEVIKRITAHPKKLPQRPADPVKTR